MKTLNYSNYSYQRFYHFKFFIDRVGLILRITPNTIVVELIALGRYRHQVTPDSAWFVIRCKFPVKAITSSIHQVAIHISKMLTELCAGKKIV